MRARPSRPWHPRSAYDLGIPSPDLYAEPSRAEPKEQEIRTKVPALPGAFRRQVLTITPPPQPPSPADRPYYYRPSYEHLPMPTYEYACTSCDNRVEVFQSFTDDPLEKCERCGGKLRRVFHPVGVMFKGSGFYSTDAKASKKGSDAGPAKAPAKAESGAKGSEGGASDSSKPASKPSSEASSSSGS